MLVFSCGVCKHCILGKELSSEVRGVLMLEGLSFHRGWEIGPITGKEWRSVWFLIANAWLVIVELNTELYCTIHCYCTVHG